MSEKSLIVETCGCRVKTGKSMITKETTYFIFKCPLHKHAEEMRDFIERLAFYETKLPNSISKRADELFKLTKNNTEPG